MVKLNSLLADRFKKKEKASDKMQTLGRRSGSGQMSSFGGVFRIAELSEHEKQNLIDILNTYKGDEADLDRDLSDLCTITSEVKAINNQAVVLHGERIQKAQAILKDYQDGAFTEWMISAYGNRQTPYNFLQYYEFYTSLSELLRKKTDDMPRQVVYTLASRKGDHSIKEEIVSAYEGQTKQALLNLIREKFPLDRTDKRTVKPAKRFISGLKKFTSQFEKPFKPTPREKDKILALIRQLRDIVEDES